MKKRKITGPGEKRGQAPCRGLYGSISFNPPRTIIPSLPLRQLGTRRLNNLPKVTWPVGAGVKVTISIQGD